MSHVSRLFTIIKENCILFCEKNVQWNWIQGSLSYRKSVFPLSFLFPHISKARGKVSFVLKTKIDFIGNFGFFECLQSIPIKLLFPVVLQESLCSCIQIYSV